MLPKPAAHKHERPSFWTHHESLYVFIFGRWDITSKFRGDTLSRCNFTRKVDTRLNTKLHKHSCVQSFLLVFGFFVRDFTTQSVLVCLPCCFAHSMHVKGLISLEDLQYTVRRTYGWYLTRFVAFNICIVLVIFSDWPNRHNVPKLCTSPWVSPSFPSCPNISRLTGDFQLDSP